MKVVINQCWGGFNISLECARRMAELGSEDAKEMCHSYDNPTEADLKWSNRWYGFLYKTERHDPILVQAVEELGEKANGSCAELSVVEIPDGVEYEIDDYDGMESIHERHRSWY